MATREILWCGHPALRKKSKKVTSITEEVVQLLADMSDTMVNAPGLGLAAPQVGESVRAIVVREDVDEDSEIHCLINPRVIRRKGNQEGIEGCLSLPTLQGIVQRAAEVVVEGTTPEGETVQVPGEGMLARALQHEIDHLDGILFMDRVDADTLGWMVPDKEDEDGYRIEPTTVEEVVARFTRLRQEKESRQQ